MAENCSREKERMEDLLSYRILGNQHEPDLDELAELASLICNAPISLITLIDEDFQWFLAKTGTSLDGTRREDAFCIHTLDHPNDLMLVPDAKEDKRFVQNPMVTGEGSIRFYAGAPIVSVRGNVLGTICVLDHIPRELDEKQQNGLKILAKKAHKFMHNRKVILNQKDDIDSNAEKLRKLTYSIPSTIFQLRRKTDLSFKYDFISLGDFQLPESILEKEIKKNPIVGFNLVYEKDRQGFMDSLEASYTNLELWNFEYRVEQQNQIFWYMVKAIPERQENGDVVWYGCFVDITSHVKYEETIEQIAFDISHVMRKPIANLLGLASLIQHEENINEKSLKVYAKSIFEVSQEMDNFSRELDRTYQSKKNSDFFKTHEN